MSLVSEILKEMGEYEEETHKDYADYSYACDHAKEFLDRAAHVLQYDNKNNEEEDVVKMAKKYAKDYHNAIVDEIDCLSADGNYDADKEFADDDKVEDYERVDRRKR